MRLPTANVWKERGQIAQPPRRETRARRRARRFFHPFALVPGRGAAKPHDELEPRSPEALEGRSAFAHARGGATDRTGLTNGGPPGPAPEVPHPAARGKRTLFGREGRRAA